MSTSKLLDAVLVTGAGASFAITSHGSNQKTFQAKVVGTGAVSATVLVQGSNDGTYWEDLNTFTLSGTTSDHDGWAHEAPWGAYRGNVSAISGTGAAVTLTMVR